MESVLKKNTVFVYGTLRTGASNAFRMRGARSLGRATISARLYRVHDEFPGAVLSECSEERLIGEVFTEVSDEQLYSLDIYEGCDDAIPEENRIYRKTMVQTTLENDEQIEVFVWEYIRSVDHFSVVESGDWSEVLRE